MSKQKRTFVLSNVHFCFDDEQSACSVKVWCTKIARILKIVVQAGVNLTVNQVTDIITYGLLYFGKN